MGMVVGLKREVLEVAYNIMTLKHLMCHALCTLNASSD